ncbi:MAG: ATP-binding protein [Myxococcota bacterium]
MSVPSDWERIESVRRAVGPALLATLEDADLADAVAMASAELMENAVKHGGKPRGVVNLALSVEAELITLRVTNPSSERTSKVETLIEMVDWIGGFGDPYEAYVQRLARVCEIDDAEGGLGLVRVAYEGRGRLSYEISQERVDVLAHFGTSIDGH